MYVHMYVCMYLGRYVCMQRMDVCMHVYTPEGTDVYVYVYIYIYIYIYM